MPLKYMFGKFLRAWELFSKSSHKKGAFFKKFPQKRGFFQKAPIKKSSKTSQNVKHYRQCVGYAAEQNEDMKDGVKIFFLLVTTCYIKIVSYCYNNVKRFFQFYGKENDFERKSRASRLKKDSKAKEIYTAQGRHGSLHQQRGALLL